MISPVLVPVSNMNACPNLDVHCVSFEPHVDLVVYAALVLSITHGYDALAFTIPL